MHFHLSILETSRSALPAAIAPALDCRCHPGIVSTCGNRSQIMVTYKRGKLTRLMDIDLLRIPGVVLSFAMLIEIVI